MACPIEFVTIPLTRAARCGTSFMCRCPMVLFAWIVNILATARLGGARVVRRSVGPWCQRRQARTSRRGSPPDSTGRAEGRRCETRRCRQSSGFRRHEAPNSLDELIPHRQDVEVGQRLSEFVGDRAGEATPFHEAHVDVLDGRVRGHREGRWAREGGVTDARRCNSPWTPSPCSCPARAL